MKKKRTAMIVYSYYPEDPRVRREAEALEEKGYKIDIFCLNFKGQKPKKEKFGNITVYRSNVGKSRGGKLSYIFEYFFFIFLLYHKVTFHFLAKFYKAVHVHNMPDFLVFIALIPKLFGSKIIIDLHDPTPEVYIAKYDIDKNHKMIRVLTFLEKLSIGFAKKVITPNIAFKRLFASRSCKDSKIDIIMNSPNEKIFQKPAHSVRKKDNQFKIIYHGSVVERHGLHEALVAIKKLLPQIPHIRFDIYGGGDYEEQLIKEIKEMGLTKHVFFNGFLMQEDLIPVILNSDLGIIPNRRNAFTEINFPTRIFEYICLGIPVIVPETIGIKDYFKNNELLIFEADNADSLANVIFDVYKNYDKKIKQLEKCYEIYNQYTWAKQKKTFS